MIERMAVTEWRSKTGWKDDATAEQDLVLSRALVELFQRPLIGETFSLRGGTALNKLVFRPATRYSEDIDLVQEVQGPIGPALDVMRAALGSWLGKPRIETTMRGTTLVWRFVTSDLPPLPLRLKVEINTREHGWIGSLVRVPFEIRNAWFNGAAEIATLALEDLLATKLRALYQRRKGRDLFDLWMARRRFKELNVVRTVRGFLEVMKREGHPIGWETLEENVLSKLENPAFGGDVPPLVGTGEFDAPAAWTEISPWLEGAFDKQV